MMKCSMILEVIHQKVAIHCQISPTMAIMPVLFKLHKYFQIEKKIYLQQSKEAVLPEAKRKGEEERKTKAGRKLINLLINLKGKIQNLMISWNNLLMRDKKINKGKKKRKRKKNNKTNQL